MNESLTKESLLEIARTLLSVSRKLATYLEVNFGRLSDGEFTTLHFLKARLTSEAGDIARNAATIQQTGIDDLQKKLEDATAEAQKAIGQINDSKKMISFIASVLDFAVDVSVGLASGNWGGVLDSGGKVFNLAGILQ